MKEPLGIVTHPKAESPKPGEIPTNKEVYLQAVFVTGMLNNYHMSHGLNS